jgi:hypothetical protein
MILEIPTDSPPRTAHAVPAAARRIGVALALMLCVVSQSGCLFSSDTPVDPSDLDPKERDQRIEALKVSIERDRAELAEWLARPDSEYSEALHDDPEMRALAARLNEQAEDLAQLEAAVRSARPIRGAAGQTRESAKER